LTELICIAAAALFALGGARVEVPRPIKHFLALVLLWLFAQVLSDLVHGTGARDVARQWAAIATTGADVVAVFLLTRADERRLERFAWGLVLGLVLETAVTPGPDVHADPWKYGYSTPATLAVALVAAHVQRRIRAPGARLFAPLLLLAVGTLSLFLGARGAALVAAIAAAVTAVSPASEGPIGKRRAFPRLATVAVCLVGSEVIYRTLATRGTLGAAALEKFQAQSRGQLGVLFGGRGDVLYAWTALQDHWFLGLGSFAKMSQAQFAAGSALVQKLGYSVDPTSISANGSLIPAHSGLMSAWLYGGIGALPVWIWVLALCASAVVEMLRGRVPLAPLHVYIAVAAVWNALFSPFGGDSRIVLAYTVVLLSSARQPCSRRDGVSP
jgi:hypothetical protein